MENATIYDIISRKEGAIVSESKLLDLSFEFAAAIVDLVDGVTAPTSSYMTDQLARAGASVGANIHEAQYTQSKKGFVAKLEIALKESNETSYVSLNIPSFLLYNPYRKGGAFMGVGIMICGLNGCGKSTLGRALADKLGFHFIDNENLYFSRLSENAPYANSKSRDEVIALLMDEVRKYDDFVFAAVKGNYGEEIVPLYDYVVLIEVPKEIRLQRVRNRSYQKFGERVLIGGDLYVQEENFFSLVASRPEDYVAKWTQSVNAPIIAVDGTKPIEENVAYIIERIQK